MKTKTARVFFPLRLFAAMPARLHAQGAAFSYQGHLNRTASPANEDFDFTFVLFVTDSRGTIVGGSPNTLNFFATPTFGTLGPTSWRRCPSTTPPFGGPSQGSDRTHKENHRPVDPETVLAKLAEILSHIQKLKESAYELGEMMQTMNQKLGENTRENQ